MANYFTLQVHTQPNSAVRLMFVVRLFISMFFSRFVFSVTYYSPPVDARYCDQPVCVSVCPIAYLENRSPNFTKFSCYLWPWFGPPPTATQHVTHFRFLWMTWRHVFPWWNEQVRIKDVAYVSSTSPGSGTGAKSAVCDCILYYINMQEFRASSLLPTPNEWMNTGAKNEVFINTTLQEWAKKKPRSYIKLYRCNCSR